MLSYQALDDSEAGVDLALVQTSLLLFALAFCLRRTGGSVGRASGCHAEGREFDSGRTNTQGLKITEEKMLPL